MSADYFDWSTVEDDIVIPEQAQVAVYCNPAGKIVLRQAGQYGPDEDTWIVLHPSHALPLARAILDRAGLDMEIVPLTALRMQNGGGEILQPFPNQTVIDAVRNAGRAAGRPTDLDDEESVHPTSDEANCKKDRTAAERQRRRREKQRQRDSVIGAVTDRDIERDTVTAAPLVPEGGQSKALAH
jgi:hypothetical protein